MLGCRRRKQRKGLCDKSIESLALTTASTLLLLLVLTFALCYHTVYTRAYLANTPYLRYDTDPVQTMTASLQLEQSWLGRFFLTKQFCLLSAQLIKGAYL